MVSSKTKQKVEKGVKIVFHIPTESGEERHDLCFLLLTGWM
jgi:hypothetical protein